MTDAIRKLLKRQHEIAERCSEMLNLLTAENRDFTEAEQTEFDKLEGEDKRLQKQIDAEQRNEDRRRRAAAAVDPTDPNRLGDPARNVHGAPEGRFQSFGEQLMAVAFASTPSSRGVDPRLVEVRAPTGASESVPSDGGFLVQTDFAQELIRRTYEVGQVLQRVRSIPISAAANGIKLNAVDETSRVDGSRWGGVQVFYEGEADQITASKPKFRQMELKLKKLTGLFYATDELLQDAAALEAIAREAFAEEMSFKYEDKIFFGTGAGEPLGFMNSGALVSVAKEGAQAADTVVLENVTKMYARMWARSRQNSVWWVNQDIEPQLWTMTLANQPMFIPAGGVSEAPFARLLGRPVIPVEYCKTLGDEGDIVLADMSQYLTIEKGGISAASSVHVRFIFDEQVFRFIWRHDGQPLWRSALTPKNGTNTLSPFVTLAERA